MNIGAFLGTLLGASEPNAAAVAAQQQPVDAEAAAVRDEAPTARGVQCGTARLEGAEWCHYSTTAVGKRHADTVETVRAVSTATQRVTHVHFATGEFVHDAALTGSSEPPWAREVVLVRRAEAVHAVPRGVYVCAISGRCGWYIDALSAHLSDGTRCDAVAESRGGDRFVARARPGFEVCGVVAGVGGHLHTLRVLVRRLEHCDVRHWFRRLTPPQRAVVRTLLLLRTRPDSVWWRCAHLALMHIIRFLVDHWYRGATISVLREPR